MDGNTMGRRPPVEMGARPQVTLLGHDGNAFNILGRCRKAARRAGWADEAWQAFQAEATSGSYDHLLTTVLEHFDVD